MGKLNKRTLENHAASPGSRSRRQLNQVGNNPWRHREAINTEGCLTLALSLSLSPPCGATATVLTSFLDQWTDN